MNPENNDQLGEGLVYEDLVPMQWRDAGKEIPPSQLIRINDSNDELLRFISVLDDYRLETSADTRGPNASDITRIEFKMNLILDLVSKILIHHVDIPLAIPVTMSASGIQWRSDEPLDPGQYIFLDIYFYQNYPRPIVLTAKVQRVDDAAEGYEVFASFEHLSDTVRRWLDKLIFKHHRRRVAYARKKTHDVEHNETDTLHSVGDIEGNK